MPSFARIEISICICDEIYHGLVYDKKERTSLEFSQRAIVINGFSKAFCMPGFRLGWAILPNEDMVRKAELIPQNLYISPPTLSQYAALGAFDYAYLFQVREIYKKRRDIILKELKGVGNIDAFPEGAFYYTKDSHQLATKLLREARVTVIPDIDFGKNNTEKYTQTSFANDGGTLSEGARRIRDYLTR